MTTASPRHGAPQPRQELPVAADPAVLAPHELEVLPGKAFVEHDVGRQRRATVDAFEEIVAGKGVLRRAALEAAPKGLDVIHALADVDAGPKQVLIDVRDGAAVDIDGGVAGEPSREPGPAAAFRRNLDAWLYDRVSGADPSAFVELRTVQRMRDRPHQARERAFRKSRVDIQRDH